MSLDPTRRFTKRAEWYARSRPSYPPMVLGILAEEIGFGKDDVVADIGAGTGILTKLFLENGNRVFAVEPNGEMRSHAERDLGGFENFVSVKGTAEHTTLPPKSVDLVAVGQALHWFHRQRAAKEFARISRPDGDLCIMYNHRKSDRLGRAYGALVKKYGRDWAKVPDVDDEYVSGFFKGGNCSKFTLPNEQSLDYSGLLGRLLSASYMPSPREKGVYASLRRDVEQLFDSFSAGGKVTLRYRTRLFVGRIG